MDACYIDYEATHSFSDALIRYLQKDPSLAPFYTHPAEIAGFSEILKNKKQSTDRNTLNQVLLEQYAGLSEVPASVFHHIHLLKRENTFTVTTGHQLNIFTGPLYFIFKIVTAINLAKELKENFPDKNFVPLYWMASEDHDFEEINHTYLFGKKIEWKAEVSGATGRLALSSMKDALKSYKEILGISENAQKLDDIVTKAYTHFPTLAQSTRYLVNELFGEFGLVIIDADHPDLKRQFSDLISRDIVEQNSYQLINQSNSSLRNIGIEPQVNPREINFFYLDDHQRERIVFDNNQYRILHTDRVISEEELRSEIQHHPQRFSPNVVMRPLYQEIILPNIAYIGGGAEMVYWLQLKSTFDFYGIDFPILLLRNSALLLDQKQQKQLEKLQLSYADIFMDLNALKNNWIRRNSNNQLKIDVEKAAIQQVFVNLQNRLLTIDQTLGPSSEAINVRLQKALNNLEKKIIKAEKRNFQEALSAIDHLKQSLFPNGVLQERKENFAQFYLKYGDNFIKTLIKEFKPLDLKFTIIRNGISPDC